MLLPLLLLSSCSTKIEFPITDDPDLIYLSRNGDNYKTTANTAHNLVKESNPTSLVAAINEGDSVFVFTHQIFCSSCKAVDAAFSVFLRDSMAMCYGVYNASREDTNITKTMEALKKNFPAMADVIGDNYYTPSFYLIKDKENIVSVTLSDEETKDANKLEERFKGLANYTGIYEFTKASAFLDFVTHNDCFYLFDDVVGVKSTFQKNVYKYALHSSKLTARVRYSSLSADDKALIASRLGNGSATLFGTYSQGTPTINNYKDNQKGLDEAIETYYSVKIEDSSSSASSASSESAS